MTNATTNPTLIAGDAAHAMASYARGVAVVWRGPMTPAAVRAIITPIGAAARRAPGEVAVVIVIETSAPVPGDDVRAAFAELIRAQHPVRGTAIVAEGSGFRSSMVRSVVTSLLLLARAGTPMKVMPTVAEAAKWVAGQGVTRAGSELEHEVIRAVEAARAKIGHTSPRPR